MILRKAYERIFLDDVDIQLAQRNNIIRLRSLIHHRWSFFRMIRYAWFKCGNINTDLRSFQTAMEACFKFKKGHCDTSSSKEFAFIRCSYCGKIVCFQHAFILIITFMAYN